jgi:hypothetical protein
MFDAMNHPLNAFGNNYLSGTVKMTRAQRHLKNQAAHKAQHLKNQAAHQALHLKNQAAAAARKAARSTVAPGAEPSAPVTSATASPDSAPASYNDDNQSGDALNTITPESAYDSGSFDSNSYASDDMTASDPVNYSATESSVIMTAPDTYTDSSSITGDYAVTDQRFADLGALRRRPSGIRITRDQLARLKKLEAKDWKLARHIADEAAKKGGFVVVRSGMKGLGDATTDTASSPSLWGSLNSFLTNAVDTYGKITINKAQTKAQMDQAKVEQANAYSNLKSVGLHAGTSPLVWLAGLGLAAGAFFFLRKH